MKKLLLTLALIAAGLPLQAATLIWGLTNWNQTLSGNATIIQPVSAKPQIDGIRLATGLAVRYANDGTDMWTNSIHSGAYQFFIEGISLPRPVYFVVPDGSGTYYLTDPNVLVAGPNFFSWMPPALTLTSSNGTVTIFVNPTNVALVDLAVQLANNPAGSNQIVTVGNQHWVPLFEGTSTNQHLYFTNALGGTALIQSDNGVFGGVDILSTNASSDGGLTTVARFYNTNADFGSDWLTAGGGEISGRFVFDTLSASSLMISGSGKQVQSLANGGANTVLHGTTPPSETPVVEADFFFSDVTTANVSTTAHGLAPKGDNSALHFLNGQGSYTPITWLDSIDIPMGAWFTNNLGDGATLTPASLLSITNAGDGFAFASGSFTNYIRMRFGLPYSWDLNSVKLGFVLACSGTNNVTATNVVLSTRAASVGRGDDLSSLSFGTAIRLTNNVNVGAWKQGTEGVTAALTVGNTPAANKDIIWEIQRQSKDGGDTETNANLMLARVRVYYTKTNLTAFPTSSP